MDQSREQEILSAFGSKLKALRNEKNLTLRQLGLNADIEFSFIGALERAEKTPSLITVIALAEGLGVDPCALLPDIH